MSPFVFNNNNNNDSNTANPSTSSPPYGVSATTTATTTKNDGDILVSQKGHLITPAVTTDAVSDEDDERSKQPWDPRE